MAPGTPPHRATGACGVPLSPICPHSAHCRQAAPGATRAYTLMHTCSHSHICMHTFVHSHTCTLALCLIPALCPCSAAPSPDSTCPILACVLSSACGTPARELSPRKPLPAQLHTPPARSGWTGLRFPFPGHLSLHRNMLPSKAPPKRGPACDHVCIRAPGRRSVLNKACAVWHMPCPRYFTSSVQRPQGSVGRWRMHMASHLPTPAKSCGHPQMGAGSSMRLCPCLEHPFRNREGVGSPPFGSQGHQEAERSVSPAPVYRGQQWTEHLRLPLACDPGS